MDTASSSSKNNVVSQLSDLGGKVRSSIAEQKTTQKIYQCHHNYLGKMTIYLLILLYFADQCLEFTCGHSFHHPDLPYPSHSVKCGGNLMICNPLKLPYLSVPIDSDCAECILKSKIELGQEETLSHLFDLLSITEATIIPTEASAKRIPTDNCFVMSQDASNKDEVHASFNTALELSLGLSGGSGILRQCFRKHSQIEKQGDEQHNTLEKMGNEEDGIVAVDMVDGSILEARRADTEVKLGTKGEAFVLMDANAELKAGIPMEDFYMRDILV